MNFQMSDLQYFNPDEWFEYGNGINSYTDLGLVVGKVSKPIMPQTQESVQDVPGMYGSIFTGNDYGELTFTIPATIMAFNHTSYNMIVDNMRAMFTEDSRDPGVEYPLIFGDQPDVKYYGHWGQMSDPTFLTPTDWQASVQLTFICSQPFGYLPQQSEKINYPDQPIYPKGTATTYPIYRIHLKQNVYNIGFTSTNEHGEYVATGYTVDDENTDDEGHRLKDNEPLDVDEEPTMLSDWYKGKGDLGYTIEGDESGQMGERSGSSGITPAFTYHIDKNRTHTPQKQLVRNYGNPKDHGNNWYGPLATHPQFNNPTDDWQLMVNLWNQKTSTDHSSDRAEGYNNIYLLDEQGNRRGRIWVHDRAQGRWPHVGFALGTHGHEVEMLNYNTNVYDSNSPTGPVSIGNTRFKIDRPQPSKFKIYNLWAYKELVKTATKAKKRSVKRSLSRTRKTRAKRRYRKYGAKKYKTNDANRHKHHHYPSGRKGR